MRTSPTLHFRDEPDSKDLRTNLSAACLTPDGHLWLASDERQALERLTWDGGQFGRHESFALADYFDLPDGDDGEIDVEGLTVDGPYLWLVGSHSRKIKKPKPKSDPSFSHVKNLRRLTWDETQTEPNRYLLGRIPLVKGELLASAADPERPKEPLTAAALKMANGRNALVEALAEDPHIGPYVRAGIPGKANGLDIEGLEVFGDRLLLGLRGPVLLDWALLVEVELKAKKDGALALKKIGPGAQPYRKFFVNLRGLGVRDLCQRGDDLLILAGPTQYLDGPALVFLLRGAGRLEEDVMVEPTFLFEIPCGVGTDHPEAITLADQLTGNPALLVIHDAPQPERLQTPNSVRVDVFPLSIP